MSQITIDKGLVRKSIYNMKNGRTKGPSGLGSETVKRGGKAGTDIVTNVINQAIVKSYSRRVET